MRRRWRESPPVDGIACPTRQRWVEVKSSWPWPWWPRAGYADDGEWKSLLRIELGWWHSPSSGSFLRLVAHVVVVRMGRPPSPLVLRLACSVIVRPHDKRAVTRGGGWCPTATSPATEE
jgi:hypothetical protein